MLISTTIPSLLNGVSQQPSAQRFPTQAEAQVNAYSSVVDGLSKRPNTEFIRDTGAAYKLGNEYTHNINRDATERYMVIVGSNDIKVIGTDGFERPVNKPDGVEYLLPAAGSAFDNSIRCVTIGDYTFILNRTKTVAMDATTTAIPNSMGLVAIVNGAYQTKYTVTVNGTDYTHQTAASANDADCTKIAEDLLATYNASPQANISAEQEGYVLRFYRTDTNPFTLTVNDGLGGRGMLVVKDSVQSFTDLPNIAFDGMVVQIEGIPGAPEDDHYVQFNAEISGQMSEGIWVESLAPGVKYKYDYATMPHVLIRLSGGQFVFKKADGTLYSGQAGTDAEWAERYVGDDISNPFPSFVGQEINDIFLFKDRLGILANEAVVMSETAEYFNFWRTTVTQILDSDPIDVQSAFPQVSIMRAAIPINDRLVVFSDKAQFVLQSNQVLTPTSVSLTAATQYEMDPNIPPVSSGNTVFFAFKRSGNYGIREFTQSEQDGNLFDAPEVTAAVPKYLPPGIRKMVFNSIESCLIVIPTAAYSSELFVYKFYGSGSQRIQSSWSKFDMGVNVLGAEVFDNYLYLATDSPNENTVSLERMDFSPAQTDEAKNGVGGDNAAYKTLLDCRADETQCGVVYDAGTDQTTLTIPFGPRPDVRMVIVSRKALASGAYTTHGEILWTGYPTSRTITIQGRLESTPGTVAFYIGFQYEMLYEFTRLYLRLRRAQNGNSETVTSGRLQVRYCSVQYANSGHFKTKVIPEYGDESVTEWTGNDLGLLNSTLGDMTVSDGRYKFAVYGLNDEVRVQLLNDTFMPCSFLNAEFECLYHTRSRRA